MATISQVAKQAGLRPSALRYYEAVAVMPRAVRASGRRLYDARAVRQLEVIMLAKRAGFTLDEIKLLLRGPRGVRTSRRWQELARRKLRDLEVVLAQAQEMRRILERGLKCRCDTLDECVFCAFGSVPPRVKSPAALREAPPTLNDFLRRRRAAG